MLNHPKLRIALVSLLVSACFTLSAQVRPLRPDNPASAAGDTISLDHANKLSGKVIQGVFINIASGDVRFSQGKTLIFCDSALIYRNENRVEAFGKVRIQENDSTTIRARQANYDGNNKVVEFRNRVEFVQRGGISLFTDYLDYDRERKIAVYRNGGKLVDSTNVLTSTRGYYAEYTRMASFGRNVKGTSPDWDLVSDTLQYNTMTKVIYFHSATQLTNKDGKTANYDRGTYDTQNKISRLDKGQFETMTYLMEGLKIGIDDSRKVYKATGDVVMVSKEDNVIITGESAEYDRAQGIIRIWDNPLMKKIVAEGDTLYLKADTLVSLEREDGDDRLLAYHHVVIYKHDLQGLADSAVYQPKDSMMFFYREPILWTESTQLTADTLSFEIANQTIDKLHLNSNAFIISQDSIANFNQVKGRSMTTYFKDQQIERVHVTGNGESIYYVMEEDYKSIMGMNKVVCSNMLIRFRNNFVNTITFYINDEGDFIPPHELYSDMETLPGFLWREEEKPDLFDVAPYLLPDRIRLEKQ